MPRKSAAVPSSRATVRSVSMVPLQQQREQRQQQQRHQERPVIVAGSWHAPMRECMQAALHSLVLGRAAAGPLELQPDLARVYGDRYYLRGGEGAGPQVRAKHAVGASGERQQRAAGGGGGRQPERIRMIA